MHYKLRVAKAFIVDKDGYTLVLRRSGTHPLHPRDPDLPGGIIEHGETYTQGLTREIYEEAGITIQPSQLELIGTHEGKLISSRRLYLLRLNDRPEVKLSWEHGEFAWVSPDDLPAALVAKDSFMQFARDHISKLY